MPRLLLSFTALSDPQLIAAVVCKRAPHIRRVVFETGPLLVWFYHALTAEGLPAIYIDARHAKAALEMAANRPMRTMPIADPSVRGDG